jgi:hypothetical protein
MKTFAGRIKKQFLAGKIDRLNAVRAIFGANHWVGIAAAEDVVNAWGPAPERQARVPQPPSTPVIEEEDGGEEATPATPTASTASTLRFRVTIQDSDGAFSRVRRTLGGINKYVNTQSGQPLDAWASFHFEKKEGWAAAMIMEGSGFSFTDNGGRRYHIRLIDPK